MRDDALIIANDGKSVTRRGVLAICASDLTEKTELQSDTPDDIPGIPDDKFLAAQRSRVINVYRADSNRLKRDARRERHVSADYGGRFLWELIQNADDAMAPPGAATASLIGTKGLGFKSILEITDKPEVFSGVFAFHFSHEKSAALLQSLGLHGDFAPIFEMPHETEPTGEVTALLKQGYATVIRLPYRNEDVARLVKSMVDGLDHRFLLFSQNLQSVRVIRDSGETRVQVSSQKVNDTCERVDLSGTGVPVKHMVWQRWHEVWDDSEQDKRLSVSLCLPLGVHGAVQPLDEDDKPPLYVFFPTEESLAVRAVVHVAFALEQNRKHFTANTRNKEVGKRLGKLLARLLTEIPADVSLKAFGSVTAHRPSAIVGRLAKTVQDTIEATAFVPTLGGPLVPPGEVKLWKGELAKVLQSKAPGIAEFKLLDPSVRGCDAILRRLHAYALEPHNFFLALKFCKNRTLEDCKRVLAVIVQDGIGPVADRERDAVANWIAAIPCWWTDRNKARALVGAPVLLHRPRAWPDFVAADALAPEMSDAVQEYSKDYAGKKTISERQQAEMWRHCIQSKFLHTDREYLEHALLPAISDYTTERWDESGWDVLRWVRQWCPKQLFEEIIPLPVLSVPERRKFPADQFRFRLADNLRLPTDKGWSRPMHCYANAAWGAPREFGAFFSEIEDRAVIKSLKSWHKRIGQRDNADEWKSVLRFIGVSWEPKLVEIASYPGHQGVEPSYRERYLKEMNRWDFDLKIEHFPRCLGSKTRTPTLLRIGQDLLAAAEKYPAKYLVYRAQYSQRLAGCTNLAEHQLRECAWLPHKGAILFPEERVAPIDAYFPSNGIVGLTPQVDIPDTISRQNARAYEFLDDLGVRKSLPDESAPWFDWMERIADASDNPDISRRDLLVAARSLYRAFLHRKFAPYTLPSGLRVPVYAGGETAENLQFVRAKTARWLDEPNFDVAAVRKQLLAHGEQVFILFLGQALDAESRLGIQRLSAFIAIAAAPGETDDDCTTSVAARYRVRVHALRALLKEPQRALLPDDLVIRAVRGLSIRIATQSGDTIAETAVRAFKEDGDALLIAASHKPWQGAGFGLARYVVADAAFSDAFETVLAADDNEEVLDRLRQRGIPEQELEHVQNAMTAADVIRPRPAVAAPPPAPQPEPPKSPPAEDTPPPQDEDEPEAAPAKPREPAKPRTPAMPASEIDLSGIIPEPPESGGGGGRSGSGQRTRTTGGSPPLRPGDQAARLRGKEAEDWFAEHLKAAFADWNIERNERDDQNRETDFVLRKGSAEFHVEVKRLSGVPGDILWSELEFRKAKEFEHRYYVALILPVPEGYRVLWVWNPIQDFGPMPRRVEWTWTGTTRSDALPADVWTPPEAEGTPKLSRRHSFRITVNATLYSRLEQDTETLTTLRSRAAAPAQTD